MSFTNAQLAQQIANLVEYWSSFNEEYASWLGGTVNGGPNSDGEYPLTDWHGNESLVKSPAKLEDDVSGLVGSASASATAAAASAAAAATSESNAAASESQATTDAAAAAASASAASTSEGNAGSSATVATTQANLALTRANAAAASEAAAAISETNADASAVAAAASAAAAATFDPALYYLKTETYSQSEVDSLLSGIDLSPYARLDGAAYTGRVRISGESVAGAYNSTLTLDAENVQFSMVRANAGVDDKVFNFVPDATGLLFRRLDDAFASVTPILHLGAGDSKQDAIFYGTVEADSIDAPSALIERLDIDGSAGGGGTTHFNFQNLGANYISSASGQFTRFREAGQTIAQFQAANSIFYNELEVHRAAGPHLTIRDTDNVGQSDGQDGWIRWEGSDGVRSAYIGHGSTGHDDFEYHVDNVSAYHRFTGGDVWLDNTDLWLGSSELREASQAGSSHGSINVTGNTAGWGGYSYNGNDFSLMWNETDDRGGFWSTHLAGWGWQVNRTGIKEFEAYCDGQIKLSTAIGGVNITGLLSASGQVHGNGLAVTNTSQTSRIGLGLYGSNPSDPTYGILFTGLAGYAICGAVDSDWGMVFNMNNSAGRGWVFRDVTNGAQASISNDGIIAARAAGFAPISNSLDTGAVHYAPTVPGGALNNTTPSQTGYLRIRWPLGEEESNAMCSFTIQGYNYDSKGHWAVRFSGYEHVDTNPWVNARAEIIYGTPPFDIVRWGRANSNTERFILLGDSTTSWDYAQIVITDFFAGFSGQNRAMFKSDWDLSISSSTPTGWVQTAFDYVGGSVRWGKGENGMNLGGEITMSTSGPSGGQNGDIHFEY